MNSLMYSFRKLFIVIGNSHRHPLSGNSKEHSIKVFTRLMLEGNVCAAVR